MAYIIGRAADRGASGRVLRLFGWMVAGDAAAFVLGYLWLLAVATAIVQSGAALPGWLDAGNLAGTAFDGAIKPFALWDIVKMAFGAATVSGLFALLRRKA